MYKKEVEDMAEQDRIRQKQDVKTKPCTRNEREKETVKELFRLRRWLHSHPELSMEEEQTSRFIADYLETFGIPCRIIEKTGVIGTLMAESTDETSLPTIAIRAEIDGLPICENTGLPFSSVYPGRMHACGHDAITAVVLCLARVLAEHVRELKYNIRFLFEPAEETGEGARYMIENGALEEPRPDAVLIFHFGNQETRSMEIQKSISTAAVGGLQICVKGKASHWSQRAEGIDALYAASRVVTAIHTINETFQTQYPFVLGFGMMNAGTGGNIMAEEAQMRGSLRAFTEADFDAVYEELQKRISEISEETGAKISLEIIRKIPPIINDGALAEKGAKIGKELFGDRFSLGEKPFLVGDNAAFYMQQVPGLRSVFLAGKEGGEVYPVHNPKFDIDEEVMVDALHFLYRFCCEV
ncbi:MAG: M20 family metallopeptidase [Lachnospiraceae bacterium]|nr:M20 family metallopeptidase [Lachnospiraceae bacterium]